jgi:hypothetical protein
VSGCNADGFDPDAVRVRRPAGGERDVRDGDGIGTISVDADAAAGLRECRDGRFGPDGDSFVCLGRDGINRLSGR